MHDIGQMNMCVGYFAGEYAIRYPIVVILSHFKGDLLMEATYGMAVSLAIISRNLNR